jgi:hypothetical protein
MPGHDRMISLEHGVLKPNEPCLFRNDLLKAMSGDELICPQNGIAAQSHNKLLLLLRCVPGASTCMLCIPGSYSESNGACFEAQNHCSFSFEDFTALK